jgi:hypothetical protein
MSWRLSTIDPLVATIGPSPATGPPPDLRITAVDRNSFTVANSGAGPAGPFFVSVDVAGSFAFPGLAAGASITQPAPQACRDGAVYRATADSAGQVAESDETNNVLSVGPVFC